jgi:hypothetical protein
LGNADEGNQQPLKDSHTSRISRSLMS